MTAWTKERPTEPGWYWLREDGYDGVSVVELIGPSEYGEQVVYYSGIEMSYAVSRINGEWQRAEPKP